MKIEIDEDVFWAVYNALHDAEDTLWRCDGATNPEDAELAEEIEDTRNSVEIAMEKIFPIVEAIKDK